jgi:predicted nuclease with TOPRIM domain
MGLFYLLFVLLILFPLDSSTAKTPPPNFKVTNEMIYQQLMELREEHAVFREKFNGIERRFEEIDKRFEQIDKRFDNFRNDINKRFEQIDRRISELREDTNKRFDDMNKRFDELNHHLDVITGIFTSLVVFVIGFAYWDRRTIISKAKEETIKEIENSGKLITALREKAKADKELAKILKELGLL